MAASTKPIPSDVDGFDDAVRKGLTPARPTEPPQLVVQPTANVLFKRLGIRALVAIIVGYGLTAAVVALNLPSAIALLPRVAIMVGAYFWVHRAVVEFRNAMLAELQAGYTTQIFLFGGFWRVRDNKRTLFRWDYDGLWTLKSDGSVEQAPDRTVLPPGLYPSPHRMGERELWTGHQWGHVYPDQSEGGKKLKPKVH